MRINEILFPEILYHVAGSKYLCGQPLKSLYSEFGFELMFFEDRSVAQRLVRLSAGKLLEINPALVPGLRFKIFWCTKLDVPSEAILDCSSG